VEGEKAIWRDLRMKLYIDPVDLKAKYAASPAWLKKLMDAYADGLNWYLATHPHLQPRLITRFEPWMALAFSEGSIGGDIETIDLKALEAFHGPQLVPRVALADLGDAGKGFDPEPSGSNGFAIAPARTTGGHALLLINPHTSFYFRPEIHMVSNEGLNAYGAVTWGRFFIYQGFNDRIGWMHTSGGGDVIDEYLETVDRRDAGYVYRYGACTRSTKRSPCSIRRAAMCRTRTTGRARASAQAVRTVRSIRRTCGRCRRIRAASMRSACCMMRATSPWTVSSPAPTTAT